MTFYTEEEIKKHLTEEALGFKSRLTRWMRTLVADDGMKVGTTAVLEMCALVQAVVTNTMPGAIHNAKNDKPPRTTLEVADIVCGYDRVKHVPFQAEGGDGPTPVLYLPDEILPHIYKDDALEMKKLLKRRGVLLIVPDVVETTEPQWRSRRRRRKKKDVVPVGVAEKPDTVVAKAADANLEQYTGVVE